MASDKLRDIIQLAKLRLSLLVVFSAVISFLLASNGPIDWMAMSMLAIGGLLVTGGSNGLNQIIEKDLDKLMDRTAKRPLPTGRLSVQEALWSSLLMGLLGIVLLAVYTNILSAILGLAAMLLYAFLYTPMKQKTALAVFVGAVPGAIPPMLGWVAVTGQLDMAAWVLFGIQFIWQFPHFWSLAWVLHDDYQKAGFNLLPSKHGRDRSSAFQTVFYTLILIPVSLLPTYIGLSGNITAILALICGVVFFIQSLNLYFKCSVQAARQLMFGSFFYLPLVQLAILIDKI